MKNNNKRNIGLLFLFAILSCIVISSCKVTKDYSKPKFEMPDVYKIPDSLISRVDSAIPSWKDFFEDTVLIKILDSTIVHNFDIRDALKNIEISNQSFKQSRYLNAPDVNLEFFNIDRDYHSRHYYSSPSSGWYDDRGKKAPKDFYLSTSHFSNSVAVDWELNIWGKISRQKEAARADYLQSYEAKKAVQTALIAEVADIYYALLMLDEQLQVAQRNYNLRNNTLKMIQLQYESGDVTALAVQQAKTQVLEASALIPGLKKEIAINENALRLLTGDISAEVKRTKHLSEMESDKFIQEIPLYLVQNRPDVLVSEYKLIAANANVGVAQSYRFPNIHINLSGGTDGMLAKNWFSIPGSLFGDFVGGITQPLFNKRKLKTDYEVAKLERDISEIDFQKSVYNAITETRNARISIQQIREQLAIANEQVRVAQKAVQSAAMLFKAGFATYLEVITAQSEELDSELNLASLKADLLSARVQLYRALGGGWK